MGHPPGIDQRVRALPLDFADRSAELPAMLLANDDCGIGFASGFVQAARLIWVNGRNNTARRSVGRSQQCGRPHTYSALPMNELTRPAGAAQRAVGDLRKWEESS